MSPLTLTFYSEAEAAALLPCSGGWVLENAAGEALALFDDYDESDYWIEHAKFYYYDAAMCGHPGAASWLAERAPLVVRIITCEERDDILADGTPVLQYEGP